jgi:hypothetical protein
MTAMFEEVLGTKMIPTQRAYLGIHDDYEVATVLILEVEPSIAFVTERALCRS